jgi:hypothetical protein
MTDQERDVQRKLKVLRHAEQTGNIAKTCRYFGIGRASFYVPGVPKAPIAVSCRVFICPGKRRTRSAHSWVLNDHSAQSWYRAKL